MGVAMHLLQFLDADVRLDERGFKPLVPQHLRHELDVCSMVEHRRRHCVTKHMGAPTGANSGLDQVLMNKVPDAVHVEWFSGGVQKKAEIG
jgi:hypothetical protein